MLRELLLTDATCAMAWQDTNAIGGVFARRTYAGDSSCMHACGTWMSDVCGCLVGVRVPRCTRDCILVVTFPLE